MRRRPLAHLFGGEGVSAVAARGRGALRLLRGDKRGAAALVTAMAATSLLGVTGLAVEVGGWYLLRRNMQAAADAAAIAGALSFDGNLTTSGAAASATGAVAAAKSVTARNGFVHGTNGNVVDVATDATGRITVTVQRESTAVLLRAAGFGDSSTQRTISATGVAQVVDAGAPPCVLATTGPVSVGNNTDITAPICGLASNSAATDAFHIGSGGSTGGGSGKIVTANIVTHGGCEGCAESMGDKLTLTRSLVASSYAPNTKNEYDDLSKWTPPADIVSKNNCKAMPSTMPLEPGCYNSISSKNNSPANLKPGVYYIRSGNLEVKGDLTCTTCTSSEGVSIVLVGAGTGEPGQVDINSKGNIDLNASAQPTQSALDGVLIYRHDPSGTPAKTSQAEIKINGGAGLRLDGAFVAPTSAMSMGGNAETSPETCNIFVVATMEFHGNTNLSADGCDMYGTARNTPRIARLVQ